MVRKLEPAPRQCEKPVPEVDDLGDVRRAVYRDERVLLTGIERKVHSGAA